MTEAEILENFSELTSEDIKAWLAFRQYPMTLDH
ncbi:DUF433 domain-containing protein [Westiellopsis prolifica IICB1]|nr:DUF433 domain-containing protein [Westiellopsis prolifica IICB1]